MQKVLIVCARNYFPLDGGDKAVSIGLLKGISASAKVFLVNIADERGFVEETTRKLSPHCERIFVYEDKFLFKPLALILSYIICQPFYKTRRSKLSRRRKDLLNLINTLNPDVIIWDHMRSASYFARNDRYNILLEHNNEAKIYKEKVFRYIPLFKPFLNLQVKLLEREERRVQHEMNKIVFLNEMDIDGGDRHKKCFLPVIVTDFPLLDYKVKTGTKLNLLFVGRLDWYPNRDGILWFVENVLPLLPENFHLNVVGRNPDESLISSLNEQRNRVTLFMDVPLTTPYFLDADIFVSPIFIGSGINIKIAEAASYCMPIVMTRFSKKGFNDLAFVPAADNADEFKQEILKLAQPSSRLSLSREMKAWYEKYLAQRTAAIRGTFLKQN